jgi:N utilization substance protein B
MARRTRAREVALQLLYLNDQNKGGYPLEEARTFMRRRLQNEELEKLADGLYAGSRTHKAEIDRRIADVAENWSVERMAVVDRNILRLGVYELLYQPDTPPRVVINEAVELAKRFGSAESPAFVNGILDRLAPQSKGSPS